MTKALQTTEVAGFGQEIVSLVKSAVCPDLNESEVSLYLHQCKTKGLDPLSRSVYAFVNTDKKGQRRLSVALGIDGARAKADETGAYRPGSTEFTDDEDNNLVSATVGVWRKIDGEWFEIRETAYMAEFNQGSFTWKRFPRVMLSKVAESRALRRAFPQALQGLHTIEEMESVMQPTVVIPPARVNKKVEIPFEITSGEFISGAELTKLKAGCMPHVTKIAAEQQLPPKDVWFGGCCAALNLNPLDVDRGCFDKLRPDEADKIRAYWTQGVVG